MAIQRFRDMAPSISVAVILCSRSLTELVDIPFGSVMLYILSVTLSFIFYKKILLNINIAGIITFVLVFFMAGILMAKSNVTEEYLLYFICFGVLASFIPIKFEFETVYKFIIIIGLILLYPYLTVDYSTILTDAAQKYMDMSYKVLIFIITGFLCLLSNFSKCIKILSAVVTVGYSIIFFAFGSRGAIVSLLTFLVLYWIINADSRQKMIKKFVISAILMVIGIWSFESFVPKLYVLLSEHGISVLAIDRLYQMIIDGRSISTGRDYLADIALRGISENPIFGYGIGSFDNYSGIYPHNIWLQLLWEGGIILTLPIFIYFIIGVINIFDRKYQKKYRVFLLLILSSGVIQLFFSSHLWMSISLWIFVWMTMRKKIRIC